MNYSYSKECSQCLEAAKTIASQTGGILGTEHLIAGFLRVENSRAYKYLNACGLDYDTYARITLNFDGVFSMFSTSNNNAYKMSTRVEEIMRKSKVFVEANQIDEINSDLILYLILKYPDSYGVKGLLRIGIDINNLQSVILSNIREDELNIEVPDDSDLSNDDTATLDDFIRGFNESGNPFDIFNETSRGQNRRDRNAEMHNGGKSGLKGLEKYGEDLTEKARAGKLDPVIGRKDEVDRIIQILSRRTKNNPVLIGEPGVGKSAIVEGLAQSIVKGEVPEMLKDKIIFSLDITSMVAGAKYRGEFEERIKEAIDIVKKNTNIILFIDEIHMIVGAGDSQDGSMDAANILKPQLARGELQTIGATTIEEYRKYIEKDAALERRFQPVMVEPPTVEDTILILKGIREKYEKHHSVTITDEAIEAAAKLSDRYISDRFLPDKAIDLIDEAASRKHIGASVLPKDVNSIEEQIDKLNIEKLSASKKEDYVKAAQLKTKIDELQKDFEAKKKEWKSKQSNLNLTLKEEDIAEIVSSWTKIPVVKLTESESEKLLGLEDLLRKRVVGQDEAVTAVAKAVRRARVGIKDPKRPIGSFIFLGPTGVGKTELSKALAEAMFGDENLMVRIDMSEYMEAINVSKLIGSAPGYVGYDEGGQLTEKVRRNPYSVVLFDEIEKAHPDVFNILLQILEDGRLTDSHGRTISFKNTIIIMTSNIGASEIKAKTLGFGGQDASIDYENMKEKQMAALKRTLKPEFINRIDDIVIFRAFEKSDMKAIAALMVGSLKKRLQERGIEVSISDSALDVIIDKGFNAEYGARPLRRALQSMVEDELATRMLKNEFAIGDKVDIAGVDGKLEFKKSE